jgi:hypothetical protein
VTFFASGLAAKRLGLLRDLLPAANSVGFLVNPNNPLGESETRDAEAAARALGLRPHVLTASSDRDVGQAFPALPQRRDNALQVASDPWLGDQANKLVELAARYALPTIYPAREFPEVGGLMSYGASQKDAYRQAGIYAAKILRGAKPVALPVMQPSRFEFVINVKTAKALASKSPTSYLRSLMRSSNKPGSAPSVLHLLTSACDDPKRTKLRDSNCENAAMHHRSAVPLNVSRCKSDLTSGIALRQLLALDFTSSRAQSMNRPTTGLRARCFRVTTPVGTLMPRSSGKALTDQRLALK